MLLDEATSNIDFEMDSRIQNLLNTFLKDSTIITIAHRLNTIIGYDKIIYIENGRVIETGSPKQLLNR